MAAPGDVWGLFLQLIRTALSPRHRNGITRGWHVPMCSHISPPQHQAQAFQRHVQKMPRGPACHWQQEHD